jgi:hypothetical protein
MTKITPRVLYKSMEWLASGCPDASPVRTSTSIPPRAQVAAPARACCVCPPARACCCAYRTFATPRARRPSLPLAYPASATPRARRPSSNYDWRRREGKGGGGRGEGEALHVRKARGRRWNPAAGHHLPAIDAIAACATPDLLLKYPHETSATYVWRQIST